MAKRVTEVEIKGNVQGLKSAITEGKSAIGGLDKAVKAAGAAMLAAFAAQKVIGGLKDLVVNLGNTADRLLDLEVMTGLSTDALQEYEYVAKVAGVSTETLANASMGLTRKLAGATTEAGPLNLALSELGVSAYDAAGNMRDGGALMDDVIDKLAAVENQSERNVLGARLFGGAWKDMAPVLAMGADGIEKLRTEAREMGLVMSKDSLQAANEFRISTEKLNAQMKAVGQQIGMALIPILTKAVSGVMDMIIAIRDAVSGFMNFARENKIVAQILAGFTTYVGVFFDLWKAGWSAVLNAIKDPKKALQDMADFVKNQVINRFKGLFDMVIDGFTVVGKGAKGAAQAVAGIFDKSMREDSKHTFAEMGEAAKSFGSNYLKMLTGIEDPVEKIGGAWDYVKNKHADATDRIVNGNKSITESTDRVTKATHETAAAVEQQAAALGQIEALEKKIADEKQAFVKAVSDEERVAALDRLTALEQEKLMIEEIAKATIAARSLDLSFGGDMGEDLFADMGFDFEEIIEGVDGVTEAIATGGEALINWADVAMSSASEIGAAFGSMSQSGKKSASEILKQSLAKAVGMLIPKIIASVPFPANLAVAAGAPALAGALFSKIPAFADGGRVTSPTLAMFGEYPGASTNPEYALRQDQLIGLMQGATQVHGTATVKGQDLVIAFNEANRRNKTIFGS
jgi:hypothetical protein